jgi:hypothetical protein
VLADAAFLPDPSSRTDPPILTGAMNAIRVVEFVEPPATSAKCRQLGSP